MSCNDCNFNHSRNKHHYVEDIETLNIITVRRKLICNSACDWFSRIRVRPLNSVNNTAYLIKDLASLYTQMSASTHPHTANTNVVTSPFTGHPSYPLPLRPRPRSRPTFLLIDLRLGTVFFIDVADYISLCST
jgi:hypothetical protein